MASDNSELQRAFDGVRLHEPRPSGDGLTHRARIGARAAWSRQRAAHEGLPACDDLYFLFLREQVLDRSQAEPHRPDNGEDDAKLDPQHGDVAVCRARAFACEQRRDQNDGGDSRLRRSPISLMARS